MPGSTVRLTRAPREEGGGCARRVHPRGACTVGRSAMAPAKDSARKRRRDARRWCEEHLRDERPGRTAHRRGPRGGERLGEERSGCRDRCRGPRGEAQLHDGRSSSAKSRRGPATRSAAPRRAAQLREESPGPATRRAAPRRAEQLRKESPGPATRRAAPRRAAQLREESSGPCDTKSSSTTGGAALEMVAGVRDGRSSSTPRGVAQLRAAQLNSARRSSTIRSPRSVNQRAGPSTRGAREKLEGRRLRREEQAPRYEERDKNSKLEMFDPKSRSLDTQSAQEIQSLRFSTRGAAPLVAEREKN
jgi:hypothetical protein